jgi:hypothetical protein
MTLSKLGLMGGALAALCLPAAAQAQTAHVDSDARCLAVSMIMAGSQDATAKTLGPQGVTYFLGRIDGRGAHEALQARLKAQFEGFRAAPQGVQTAAQSCMQIMHDRALAFRGITDQLAAAAGATVAAPAPAAPPAQ